jgi:hypothetical protein
MIFNQDDYYDKGTVTETVKSHSVLIQTDIKDLCGDSVGVKKRNLKFGLNTVFPSKSTKPVHFSEPEDYSEKVLKLESNNLLSNPMVPELKKKHIRVRKLLSSIEEVINKQEHPRRDDL